MNKVDIIRKNVRKVLEAKQIKQAQLAEKMGVEANYISDILRGKKGQEMKIPFAEKLAEALEVSFEELISLHCEVKTIKENQFKPLTNNSRLFDVLNWMTYVLADNYEEGTMWLRREFRKKIPEYNDWLKKQKKEN